MPALKEEIAKFYDGLTTDHVIVTSGGSEAIFSIYAALCKPGDHMVCEAPNYPSNYGIPEGLGMEYSLCHMKFEDNYRLDMDHIKSMVTDKTKVRWVTVEFARLLLRAAAFCDHLAHLLAASCRSCRSAIRTTRPAALSLSPSCTTSLSSAERKTSIFSPMRRTARCA